MNILEDMTKCSGCMACKYTCYFNAIDMVEDSEGFFYPQINADKCRKCGKCQSGCPIRERKKINNCEKKGYICYSLNKQIRKTSTSGGVFSELSKEILKSKGYIYGAVFDEKFRVKHVRVGREDDLANLRGSKYVQSDISGIWKQIENDLENGKKAMFVGMPCQVGGLLAFLGKKYENLITVDFVCYGAASPKVWEKYLDKFWSEKRIKNIVFKDKRYGWDKWHFKVDTEKNTYWERGIDNLYMNGYLKGIFLRRSCYSCNYKGIQRESDITLADCWGIEEISPNTDKKQGVSAVMINSLKGEKLFAEIGNEIFKKETNIEELFRKNPYMYRNAIYNNNREKFFSNLEQNSKKAFKKNCRKNVIFFYLEKIFIIRVKHVFYNYLLKKEVGKIERNKY